MYKLKEYIKEDSKNTHMEHVEDLVFNEGVAGTRKAINFLRDLRNMLAGNTATSLSTTVKWDGAPAVFAGIDPTDGKFFVAKKGVFNKNPKVYKTAAEVDEDTSGDLAEKLKIALVEFRKFGITSGVYQGDLMFTNDKRVETIDGVKYITFHPNTIVYAIPKNSELAREILASRIGVVWHTTYRGDSLESMSASFGEEIATRLKKTKAVWSVDAMYKDVSGSANFNAAETKEITELLSKAGKIFSSLKRSSLDGISDNDDLLIRVKAFINSKVRTGERIGNTAKFVDDLVKYVHDYYQKEIDKKATERAKASGEAKRAEVMKYFSNTPKSDIIKIFDMYDLIVDAKHMVVRKLDKAKQIGTFLKTADGYKVTEQEGFVAIDHMGKNAVKLIDRLQFSRANFSPEILKGWHR
jgi:hypothetical protein